MATIHHDTTQQATGAPQACNRPRRATTPRAANAVRASTDVASSLVLTLLIFFCGSAKPAIAETLSLLSVPENPLLLGVQADRQANSCGLDIAGNAVFGSDATQLVAADRNGESDVFFKDLGGGAITRLSRHANGSENPESTSGATMSDNGTYVAMLSRADLIGNLPPGEQQLYLLNRVTGTITLISKSATGVPGNALSAAPQVDSTGAFVVFSSAADNLVANDANETNDVFRFDIAANTLLRVSTDSLGNEGNGSSSSPQVAAGGNVIAFASSASNLVGLDGNGLQDVFVKDLTNGVTERISRPPFAPDLNALSTLHGISEDGEVVAFASSATNVIFGDSNDVSDVFVHTRSNGITERASTDASGAQADGASRSGKLSGNGRLVAFISAASNLAGLNPAGLDQLYLKDMQTGAVQKLTSADSAILNILDFNTSGARICFNGGGETLVPGDSNRVGDVYTITVANLIIRRVNLASSPHPLTAGNASSIRPDLSDDGRYVTFSSGASMLDAEGFATAATTSSGFYQDIYLRDNATGAIERLSTDASGSGGDNSSDAPAISADGRFVTFESAAENLVSGGDSNDDNDVFRVDTATGAMVLISGDSFGSAGRGRDASISDIGGSIAFVSTGEDLVGADTNSEQDVFVWNVVDGIRRVSVSSAGIEADDGSSSPDLSGDGSVVVFASGASNLVVGDSNGHDDIFVHTLSSGAVERISVASDGGQANGRSSWPVVSRDGRYVAFVSEATNLAPGDLDPGFEIILLDRATGTLRSASADLAALGLLEPAEPWLSPDGRIVLYRAVDSDGFSHLLRYDRDTDHLTRLLAGDPGGNTDSQIPAGYAASADGRLIVFDTVDRLLVADNNDPDSHSDIYALRLEPGALGLQVTVALIDEAAGMAVLRVRRVGGSDGLVRIRYAIEAGSATAGDDYTAVSGNLTWPDDDTTARFINVPILDDDIDEENETLSVRLLDPLGGAGLGISVTTLTIVDNDVGASDFIFSNGFEG